MINWLAFLKGETQLDSTCMNCLATSLLTLVFLFVCVVALFESMEQVTAFNFHYLHASPVM